MTTGYNAQCNPNNPRDNSSNPYDNPNNPNYPNANNPNTSPNYPNNPRDNSSNPYDNPKKLKMTLTTPINLIMNLISLMITLRVNPNNPNVLVYRLKKRAAAWCVRFPKYYK